MGSVKRRNRAVNFNIWNNNSNGDGSSGKISSKQDISVEVVNARFIKPMDEEMLREFQERNIPIITVEESVLQGGFGSAVLEFYQ